MFVRRSNLIMPIIRQDFVEKAWSRSADAVTLDLEDSVPDSKKGEARELIQNSVRLVAKGGSDVLIRVNNEPLYLKGDLEFAVVSGVRGIILPKVETAENVVNVDLAMANLESKQNLRKGGISLTVVVETARGLANALEIAAASNRVESMSVGFEDLCTDLNIANPSSELFTYTLYQIVIAAKTVGATPLGLAGSIGDLNTTTFRESAIRSKNLGIRGAMAINPSQVSILNEVFSPTAAEVAESKKIVKAYEASISRQSGAMKLEDRMVDKPVYLRAKDVVYYSEAINKRLGQP
ncbi:MAG: CoA ester lyase [Nitrososphaerota archaeon]|nr:CoA ester lyase [Nitrososphaerota archaeon]